MTNLRYWLHPSMPVVACLCKERGVVSAWYSYIVLPKDCSQ